MTKPRLLTQPGFSIGCSVPEATNLTNLGDVATIGSRCLLRRRTPVMSTPSENPFRQRLCNASACRRLFFLCSRCDRGQRYCSDPCRSQTRREQLRAANRRYQQSPEGREGNRDRQQAFRRHKTPAPCSASEKTVTDQSSQALLTSRTITPRPETAPGTEPWRGRLSDFRQLVCRFCGRVARFLNPFHASD